MKRVFALFFSLALILECAASHASKDAFSAKAVYVMDAKTGESIIAKNPDLKLPPASTVKLLMAMVVLDRKRLDDIVVISRRAAGASPIKADFSEGERLTVKALLYAALMRSANDAAYALAEAVSGSEEAFVRLMNIKAKEIGAGKTRLMNSTGLPHLRQCTTARDLALIMEHALRHPLIKEILETKETVIITEGGRRINIKNVNKLLWMDGRILAGKTGYTRGARHCVVFLAGNGRQTLIAVVMGSASRRSLWDDSVGIVERAFDAIEESHALNKNMHKEVL
jgi:D-alanyl-D-alanine carboxypeptidase